MADTKKRSNLEKRKKQILICVKCMIGFFFSTIFQETLAYHFGVSFWPLLSKYIPIIIAIFIGGGGCLALFPDKNREAFLQAITCTAGVTFGEHALYLMKRAYIHIKRNTLIVLILFGALLIYFPAYAASEGTGRMIFDIAERTMDCVIPREPTLDEEEEGEEKEKEEKDTNSSSPSLSLSDENNSLEQPKTNQPDVDDSLPKQKKRTMEELAKCMDLSEDMKYVISTEELSQIFFLDGDYAVEDWNDEAEILLKVWEFVEDKQSKRWDCDFQENTPQFLLNDVSNASQLETELLYEESPTATKLCRVIDFRIEVYNPCKVYILTRLIREDFCCYADAYRWKGKSKDAAAILYEQSILWGFEALQYKSDTSKFQEDLQKLDERYLKLSSVLVQEEPEYQYALALAKAFKTLANEL